MTKPSRPSRIRKRFSTQYGRHPSQLHEGVTVNVSETGVAVRGPLHPEGTVLRVIIRPVDQRAFEMEGTVAWADPVTGHMGLALRGGDVRYQQFIARSSEAPPAPPSEKVPIPPAISPAEALARALAAARLKTPPPATRRTDPAAPIDRIPTTPPVLEPVRKERAPRREQRRPARIGRGAQVLGRATTSNVSRSGLALTAESPYPAGTRVSIVVDLAEGETTQLAGRVAWVRAHAEGAEMGVQVLHADDRYKRLAGE